MEPQYSFCSSADGTRIAYAIYGSGPPVLFANTWVMSMYAQFTWPEARAFLDDLARHTKLVIFDRRGSGASDRDVDDISTDAEAEDLRAVADAAGLRSFALFGDAAGGSAVCARFAAAYPERVQRIIFWAPATSTSGEQLDKETARVFRGELDREAARVFGDDWSYARRLWAGLLYPDGPVSLQRAASRAIKESVSAEMATRRFKTEVDLGALLPLVTQPVLVLERASSPAHRFAMRVAGLLPNGRLRLVSGTGATGYPDHRPIAEAALEFLEIDAASAGSHEETDVAATAVILFVDIADSTALTERLGDAAFREKARELDDALRRAITSNGGTAIDGKLLGDGVLATFGAARGAIACASACHSAASVTDLVLHVGIHAGDVIREANNVYGGAVNIAARIADASAAGETLVSATVRDLARTSAGVSFEDCGERALKGIGEPVRVFAVHSER